MGRIMDSFENIWGKPGSMDNAQAHCHSIYCILFQRGYKPPISLSLATMLYIRVLMEFHRQLTMLA